MATRIPKVQNAVIISAAGAPSVLKLTQVPVPEPGPGQVLIRINAAGVNRHDCNQRQSGAHHDGNPVPGLEAAGTIAGTGPEVTGFAPESPVMALLQGGGYGQYALAEAALVMPVPETLSLIEAAALPEALFTAWWNFFGLMKLQPGEIAMIHGGTSGVGHLAIQALTAKGYRVIATAGSSEKVEAARSFGASAAFSYNDPALVRKVMDATGGAGVNALLDMSAGAHIDADIAMMAPEGRIAHLSPGNGANLAVPLRPLMAKRVAITGSLLRPLATGRKAGIAELIRADLFSLLGREIRPRIAAVHPLKDAATAHEQMEQGRHIGKIMLSVAE